MGTNNYNCKYYFFKFMVKQEKIYNPYQKKNIKRLKKFNRHQSDRFFRVKKSWRKPRGIDSRVRRRFRDNIKMPNIGFRTKKADRFKTRKTGKYSFLVRDEKDLECLKNQNNFYEVYMKRSLSSSTRKKLIKRAKVLGLKVINENARLRGEEATEEQE